MKTSTKLIAAGAAAIIGLNALILLASVSTVAGTMSVITSNTAKASNAICRTTSTGSTSSTVDISPNDVALKAAQAFADAGYSKAATAGVIGNLQAESGFNPTAASSDGGYGIAQWTPRNKIQKWMDANGMGGRSDSDVEVQTKMLANTAESSFNDHYLDNVKSEGYSVDGSLLDMWKQASSPEEAAIAWMAGWERPNWSMRNEDIRTTTARQYYDSGLDSITFTGVSTTDTESSSTVNECGSTSTTGNATYGEIGGAPTDRNDFGWMCEWGHICTDGDGLGNRSTDTNFYKFDIAGYQCVWYAWNRLAMIHGGGWTWVSGNGYQIAGNAANAPGWEVSASPKPGDGVSFVHYNHVAVVEKVEQAGSGWRIFVSEGNFRDSSLEGHWNEYHTRWVNQSEFDGKQVFFRRPSWTK